MRLEYRLVRRCICRPDPSTSENTKAIDHRTGLGSRSVVGLRVVWVARALGGGARAGENTHGQEFSQCFSLEIFPHPIHSGLDAERHHGI